MDKNEKIKDYEIALSYAHNDLEIAKVFKEELEALFADRFFMDERNPEELANAAQFKENLRTIFQRTEYSVILYSTNYIKGTFTHVECGAILNKERNKNSADPHFFIININVKDDEICERLSGCQYISLNVSDELEDSAESDDNKLQSRIHKIVHNHIEKNIINHRLIWHVVNGCQKKNMRKY